MARRSAGGARRRIGWPSRLAILVVLLALVGAAAQIRFDWVETLTGDDASDVPDPGQEPERVAPPQGIDLPTQPDPRPVVDPLTAKESGRVDPDKVRAALAGPDGDGLTDPRLGRHYVAMVADLAGGPPVFASDTGRFTPASTTKLLTSTAALSALGPDHRFATRVVAGGQGRIVLVGGGDPYLASKPVNDPSVYPRRADIVTLARRTAEALDEAGTRRVQVGYDATLFAGDGSNPAWEPGYIPSGEVAPIRALWVDRGDNPSGYGNVSDPSAHAAEVFVQALRAEGVKVAGAPVAREAGRNDLELAEVQGPTVAEIVERLLDVSDNETAEVLARQVGVEVLRDGSNEGGAKAVLQTLQGLGIETGGDRLFDGSGLARGNLVSPETMIDLLRVAGAPAHPGLRPVLTGMPVAGFTGSLTDRFDTGDQAALGRVRAKTGTLTGVHGLAGTATDLDGNTMVFVIVADKIPKKNGLAQLKARVAIDEMASRLGACHCSG